jgi:hypothetical protein
VSDAWQILRDAGLPLDGARSGPPGDPAELAAAVRTAIAGEPSGRASEALAAFVLAWHGHWPSSFAHYLGGDEVAWAEAHAIDRGRYLKLRRIALANLASVL